MKIDRSSNCKEYNAWRNMKARCYNPRNKQSKDYMLRGITVCDRWFHSYENFLKDMGKAPSKEHTLDRRENNGNYEPSNCRWATYLEQNNNRRDNVIHNGETLAQSCRRLGVSVATVSKRIQRGWSQEEAFSSEKIVGHDSDRHKKSARLVTYKGETARQAEVRLGLSTSTVARRIRKLGWSKEKAFTTPKPK